MNSFWGNQQLPSNTVFTCLIERSNRDLRVYLKTNNLQITYSNVTVLRQRSKARMETIPESNTRSNERTCLFKHNLIVAGDEQWLVFVTSCFLSSRYSILSQSFQTMQPKEPTLMESIEQRTVRTARSKIESFLMPRINGAQDREYSHEQN